MNIGAQLYTVRDFTQTEAGIASTLQKVSEIGYRFVHCSRLGPIGPSRLRDLLDQNGLQCVVTHTDPERILKDAAGIINEHRVLGCDSVGLSMMPERYRGSLEGLRAMIHDYTPSVRAILDAGLTFHYHNHDVEFIRSGHMTLLDILLAEMPEIKLMMCAFWVQVGGGDPIDWIERYGHRMRHVHLKDMATRPADVGCGRMMMPVLEGNMNYRGIIKACAKTKTIENLLVEQDTCDGDPFECLRISFENLTALLQAMQLS